MAENKKSFIAYTDWKDTFDALPDDKAGKLIKFIYAYVNDENPKTNDVLINAVFANIKNTLKRDLKKWETQHNQRIKAGKRSAEVRKRNATKSNARSISSTVSVSVNDSVNVNDILLKKETKKVFDNWLQYRKEIKKTIKSQKTIDSLKEKMQTEGAEKSALVVNTSIQNGWTGLFWDKVNVEKKKGKTGAMEILRNKHNLG